MSHPNICPLIFTDLDGTVLDHDTYSASPADALIGSLHETAAACVMPVTSKTQAELAALDRQLPFDHSIKISENGAVIHAPTGFPPTAGQGPETLVLGVPYCSVLEAIDRLPAPLRAHLRGFADMDAAEVSRHTGLELEAAERAKARQSTEPFLWTGSKQQIDELREVMAQSDIKLQQGGRFYHLTGAATKQQALLTIANAFQKSKPEQRFVSIALGDGPNDLEMIEAADYGVIIPNAAGAAIRSEKASVRVAPEPGPKGWVSAVTDILRELGRH